MRELSLFVVELLTDRYCSRAIDYVISEPTYAAFLENLQDRVPRPRDRFDYPPFLPVLAELQKRFQRQVGQCRQMRRRGYGDFRRMANHGHRGNSGRTNNLVGHRVAR